MGSAGEARYRRRVTLSNEQAWILTAAGLVALADGVLRGGEAQRILTMVAAALGPEEQDAWLDRLTSRDALWEHAHSLAPPAADEREGLLRAAWSIALLDGEGSADEVQALERLGARFAVTAEELQAWRRSWTAQAGELAQYVAGFAALVQRRRRDAAPDPGRSPDEAERAEFAALLARLPLGDARRQRALRLLDCPPTLDALAGSLQMLEPSRRMAALHELAGVAVGERGGSARHLFRGLAARMGVPEDMARSLLGEA